MKEILGFLRQGHPQVFNYLPEPKIELPKTPKGWVCNIIASVLGETFNKWVRKQVEARHQRVSVQKDLMIKMDPEIAKVFRQSNAVSSKSTPFPLIPNPSMSYS